MRRHTIRDFRDVRFLWMIVIALGIVGLSRVATAVIINPSQSLSPVGSGAFTGSLANDTGSESFSGTDIFNNVVFFGLIDSRVYVDSGTGKLDFTYQFSNNANSPDSIEQMTVGGYAGLITDADYVPATGAAIPSLVTRSSSGDLIGFSFPGSSAVLQGQTTDLLVIKTNASNYTLGNAAIQDGGNGNVSVFVPAPAVPEPATAAIAGFALCAFAVRRRRAGQR